MDTSTLVTMILAVAAPIALVNLSKLGLEAMVSAFKRIREAMGSNVEEARARATLYRENRLANAHRAGYVGADASGLSLDDERAAYARGRGAGRQDGISDGMGQSAQEARWAYEEGPGPDTSAAYDAGYAGRDAEPTFSGAEQAAYEEGASARADDALAADPMHHWQSPKGDLRDQLWNDEADSAYDQRYDEGQRHDRFEDDFDDHDGAFDEYTHGRA